MLEKKINNEKVVHEKLKLNIVNQKKIFLVEQCVKKKFKLCEKKILSCVKKIELRKGKQF